MGHQFTVDGDEAYKLASELAALTGETLDAVVTMALREQLLKEQRRQAYVSSALAVAEEFRALFGDDVPSSDHSWLYDDATGLPA